MTLLFTSIPEDPAARAVWLEQQLMVGEVNRLVSELTALADVAAPPAPKRTLAEVLGQYRTQVLSQGLKPLPTTIVPLLLAQPSLLLELQLEVLTEGGAYWQQHLESPVARPAIRRVRARLAPALGWRQPAWRRAPGWLLPVAGFAAGLCVAWFWMAASQPDHWGWQRPSFAAGVQTGSDYLRALADAAGEWQTRPRASKSELRAALRSLCDGCNRLLAEEHPLLPQDDRQWLLERCLDWNNKLQKLQVDLHHADSAEEISKIRTAADTMVTNLIQRLRERAQTLALGSWPVPPAVG